MSCASVACSARCASAATTSGLNVFRQREEFVPDAVTGEPRVRVRAVGAVGLPDLGEVGEHVGA
jgi:hypothetical protein